MNEKKVLTTSIGEFEIYVNNGSDIESSSRESFAKKIQTILEGKDKEVEYNDALYYETNVKSVGELTLRLKVNLLYLGIYQTITNYKFILSFLKRKLDDLKNVVIVFNNKKYHIALKSANLLSENQLLESLEKSEASLIKIRNDNKFILFDNVESILDQFKINITENFYFLNTHRETKFHEIDPKLYEARLAFAFGLFNTSISMLCITAEETLKTLLKYDYIFENQSLNKKPSLDNTKEFSNKAQKEFGSKTMEECIYAAYHKNIITDDEKKSLKKIYDSLRNALIHSDKSKLFSNKKSKITLLNMNNSKIEVVESKNLSPLDVIFIQGYLQSFLAKRDGKYIFYELEDLIFNICNNFWVKHKMDENAKINI